MAASMINMEGRATNPIDAGPTPVLTRIEVPMVVTTTARPRIADRTEIGEVSIVDLATTADPTDRTVMAADPINAVLTPVLIRIADTKAIDADRMTAADLTERAAMAGGPINVDPTPALIRIVDPMVIDADRMTDVDQMDHAVTAGDPIDAVLTPALIRIGDLTVIDAEPTVVRATAADRMTGAGPMDPAAKAAVPMGLVKSAAAPATVLATEAVNGAARMNRSPTAVPIVPRPTVPVKKARSQPAPP
ncbi:MAG: hypothetical protein HY290_03045 [Planctomycetia bacterium]|nr:hypothetical protein [Planctomycetia bacterium]